MKGEGEAGGHSDMAVTAIGLLLDPAPRHPLWLERDPVHLAGIQQGSGAGTQIEVYKGPKAQKGIAKRE